MVASSIRLSPAEVARLENERMQELCDDVASRGLTEQERDARDLEALALLETGITKQKVCDRMGQSRGWLNRILRDIHKDEVGP